MRAGEEASSKSETYCCEGLQPINAEAPRDGTCQSFAPDANICAKCGDGSCGVGENRCNCASDCKN